MRKSFLFPGKTVSISSNLTMERLGLFTVNPMNPTKCDHAPQENVSLPPHEGHEYGDVILSKESKKIPEKTKKTVFRHLLQLFGWWFGFTNLYSAVTICPFCGQQVCPVNMATTGLLGMFSALWVQNRNIAWDFLKKRLFGKTSHSIQ